MLQCKRLLLNVLMVLLVGIIACAPKNKTAVSVQDIEKYFPMQVGARWTYEIVPGEVMPCIGQIIYWSLGEGDAVVQTNKSLLVPLLLGRARQGPFLLQMRIAEEVTRLPILATSASKIVRLEIEIDEAGLYKMYKEVYWVMEEDGRVVEICYLPGQGFSGISHPVSGSNQDGYTAKPLIFPGDLEGHLVFGKHAHYLQYMGLDAGRLRFARLLELKSSQEDAALPGLGGSKFLENYFYAKGKGRDLVSLTVDGRLALIWRLIEFRS